MDGGDKAEKKVKVVKPTDNKDDIQPVSKIEF